MEDCRKLLKKAVALESEMDKYEKRSKAKQDAHFTVVQESLTETRAQCTKLLEKNDLLLATMMQCEMNQIEELEKAHLQHMEESTKATKVQRDKLNEVASSLDCQQNLVVAKNDPKAIMPTPPTTFTLHNFEETKIVDEVFYSPPFYSHPSGYKMLCKLYPNGIGGGKGTHVSVYLVIVPGEFDGVLSWPFIGSVNVQLLNRRSNNLHVSKSIRLDSYESLQVRERPNPKDYAGPEDRQVWGLNDFVAHNDLAENPGYFAKQEYLKDNNLEFRIWSVTTFSQHH